MERWYVHLWWGKLIFFSTVVNVFMHVCALVSGAETICIIFRIDGNQTYATSNSTHCTGKAWVRHSGQGDEGTST